MEKNSNDRPAFPSLEYDGSGNMIGGHLGMTLRDYFAAKAVPAIINCWPLPTGSGSPTAEWYAQHAEQAYSLADAMLAARAKP